MACLCLPNTLEWQTSITSLEASGTIPDGSKAMGFYSLPKKNGGDRQPDISIALRRLSTTQNQFPGTSCTKFTHLHHGRESLESAQGRTAGRELRLHLERATRTAHEDSILEAEGSAGSLLGLSGTQWKTGLWRVVLGPPNAPWGIHGSFPKQ